MAVSTLSAQTRGVACIARHRIDILVPHELQPQHQSISILTLTLALSRIKTKLPLFYTTSSFASPVYAPSHGGNDSHMTTMMSPQGPQVSPPLPSPSLPSHDISNDVAIDTLIEHLVNAKKALNSIDTLWRANEIVSTARSALEESVVLSARTSFLRRRITQQVRLVKRVKDGLDAIYRDGEDDFNVGRMTMHSLAVNADDFRMSYSLSMKPPSASKRQ